MTGHGTILGNLAYDAMAAIELPDGFDDFDDDLDRERDDGQPGGMTSQCSQGGASERRQAGPTDASEAEDVDFDVQPRIPFAGGSFPKEECLPLLDIGQMVSLLIGRHSGYRIRLEITPELIACLVDGQESSPDELCDLLWEAVCALL